MHKIILALLVSFALLGASSNVSAQQSPLNATDVTPVFNFTIGNWSQTYNLSVRIWAELFEINNVNLTWYMPYGLEPISYGLCNASAGFIQENKSYVSCSMNIGNVIQGQAPVQWNLTLRANVSAFPRYDSEPMFIYVNASNGTISNVTTRRSYYGKNYWINPRLGVRDRRGSGCPSPACDNSNSTVIFANWNQTDAVYQMMTPLRAHNASAGMPTLASATYADVLYFGGKEMIERPSWMRLWGYNLTFKIYFNGTQEANYWIYSPVNNTVYPEQSLFPIYMRNETRRDPMENTSFNMTKGTPSQEGFTIWYNGTEYNQTSLAQQKQINISFSPVRQADRYVLQVNASNVTTANNTEITILFTMMNFTGEGSTPAPVSPLYVDYQAITGFDHRRPPKLGENITTTYLINVSNRLTNYTLSNLKLHFFMPVNVTVTTPGGGLRTFNLSQNMSVAWWNSSAGTWNSTIGGPLSYSERNFTVEDRMPGSPSRNQNITIWFRSYDIDLPTSYFNNWNPGISPRSNVSMNMTSYMSFPPLNKSASTPGTAGSSNVYNVTVSMSMQAGLNITADELPGLTSGITPTVLVDGSPLSSANFSVGSLVINDLDSGTHSVSVSYSVAAAAEEVSAPAMGGGAYVSSATATFEVYIPSIKAGEVGTYTVPKVTNVYVTEIKVKAKNAISTAEIPIKTIDKPADVAAAPGEIFKYIDAKPSFLKSEDVEYVDFEFKVEKSWMSGKGIDAATVALHRFADNKWNKLSTSKVKEDVDYVYYSAKSPGFSYFAISGEKVVPVVVTPTPAPTTPAPITPAPTTPTPTTPAPTTPAPTTPAPTTPAPAKKICGPAAVILIAALPVFYGLKRRKL